MVAQNHELHFKFLGPLMNTELLLELLSEQAHRIGGCSCKNKWSMAQPTAATATASAMAMGSIEGPATHTQGRVTLKTPKSKH